MRTKLISILLLITTFSCINYNRPDTQIRYKEYKKEYADSLISFFPEKISNNCLYHSYISEIGAFGLHYAGIFVSEKHTRKNIERIKKDYEIKAIQITNLNEKCNQIVSRYGSMANDTLYNIHLTNYLEECKNTLIPIPNFFDGEHSLIDSSEINNCIVYTLKAQKGKFLKDENLSQGRGLTSDWTNGFSSGILINEDKREIIYWIIKW